MADYPYEGQLVADPVTFQRATSAAVTVYDASDTTNTTPLALKDGSGLPLSNPLFSSADAFTRPFYAPSQDVKLVGAGLTVFVSSPKGMRDAAAASAAAAQESANAAISAAADAAAAATAQLEEAVTSAESAMTSAADAVANSESAAASAAASAALVGAPADLAVQALINGANSATRSALASSVSLSMGTQGVIESMFARANPALSPDTPTLTPYIPSSNPPFAGQTFNHLTENVTRLGAYPVEVTQNGATYQQNQSAGQSGAGAQPWAIEFVSNTLEFAVAIRPAAGVGKYWVFVDGRPTSLAPWTPSVAGSAGNKSHIRVAFTEARTRRIRFYMVGADFGGLTIATGATISAPAKLETIRSAWVGDSYFGGSGAAEGGWPYTIPFVAAGLLGWEPLLGGIGGTGYAATSNTYGNATRTNAVKKYAPHFLIIFGSINDKGQATGTVQANAAALYAEYATALPDTKIIVIGPEAQPTDTYHADADLLALRDGVKEAADAAPNVIGFIDPVAGRWLNGTGSVAAPAGDGNADYYMASDKIHPSQLGAAYYAKRIVEEIVRVLAKAGLPWQVWTGNTITAPLPPLSDIITTNLLAEYSVSNLALADGAEIQNITAGRGSKTEPIPKTTNAIGGPLYKAADTDGKPYMHFLNGKRTLSNAWAAPLAAGTAVTMFTVYREAARGTSDFQITYGPSSTSRLSWIIQDTGARIVGTSATASRPAKTAGAWQVDAIAIDSGTAHVWQNTRTKSTVALNTASTALGGVQLGNPVAGNASTWDVRIREVILYQGRLSDADVVRTLEYLATLWSATLE